jgi:hypothetical protein
MKGKVNNVRKTNGREWDKMLEKEEVKKAKKADVVTFEVTVENLNIYLNGKTNELPPKNGKFVVYKPKKKKNKKAKDEEPTE